MSLRIRLPALALLLLAASASAAVNRETKAFQDPLPTSWDYTMEQAPDWASQLGDRRWNDRWPDFSSAAFEARRVHARDTLDRLHRIKRARLTPADQLNYDLFEYETQLALDEFQHRWFLIPL